MTKAEIEALANKLDNYNVRNTGIDQRGTTGQAAEYLRALLAENERLREALSNAPLRGRTEDPRDFDDRQAAWLREYCNPAFGNPDPRQALQETDNAG